MNGSDALAVMLGEMRSDLKWLVQHASESRATTTDLGQRVTKLEMGNEPKKRDIPWTILLRYTAGLVPLGAALWHKIPWGKAFEIYHGLLG